MAGIDGIVSGLDTTAIINGVIGTMRRPITAMEITKGGLQAKQTAYREFNTLLTTLETTLEGLDTPGEFGAYTTTSSQETQVTGTAGVGAIAGAYSLEVTALAEGSLETSNGFSAASQVIGDGTMSVTVGTTVTAITVDTASLNNTPTLLAGYINDNVLGAFAYVVDTGVAGANQFRLMVGAEETGTANAVSSTFSQTGVGAGLSFTQSNAAVDASMVFGGLTIVKSENVVSDVIPGVSLELLAPTTGTATVTVGTDATAIGDNVDTFVTAYNAVMDFIIAQRATDETLAGPLSGDSTLRTIERRLATVMGTGFATGQVSGLNEIGIGTDEAGRLVFDRTEFETGLGDHFSDVMTMVSGPTGLFVGMRDVADQVTDPTTGLIDPRIDGLDTEIDGMTEDIARQEAFLTAYEARLRAQFTQLELIMSEYQATESFLDQQIETWNSQNG